MADWKWSARGTMRRLLCWLLTHKPILRDDMRVDLPERWIECGPCEPPVTIHVMPRRTHVGETVCARCGRPLWVEGVSVRRLRG
jgi:hypothetical protein